MTRTVATEIVTALAGGSVDLFFAVELLFDDTSGTRFDQSGYVGDRAVRLWTGNSQTVIGGETYTAAGSLLSVSRMEEAADLSAKGMSVSLAGEVASLVSLALQEPYQGRRGRVLFGTTNIVETPDPYALEGVTPTLIFDPAGGVIGSRPLGPEDYVTNGTSATLIFDPASGMVGSYDTTLDAEQNLGNYYVEVFSGIIDTMPIRTGPSDATITLTLESKYVSLQRSNERRYTKENHQSRFPGDTFFDYTQSLADKEIPWGRKING